MMTGAQARDSSGGDASDGEPGKRGGASEAPHPRTPGGADPLGAPLVEWKGFRLSPFQVSAVEALRRGGDVLVSAPTGAGKTLIAEYAIEDAVRRGRRCIYTAPIKALSNQKYRDFRDDPEIDVGLMTGDVTIHAGAQVLIMTTEILRNSIFDSPQLLADVDYVVFDEVHYMDDPDRGSVWEESLIFAPPSVRFICLSATIANLGELGAWLSEIREREVVTIRSDDRPVPLEHLLYSEATGVFPLGKLHKARQQAQEPASRGRRAGGPRAKAGRSKYERGADGGRGRSRAGRDADGRREDFAPPFAGPLLDRLQRENQLPALVFAFSRRECGVLARANAHRMLLTEDEHVAMLKLQRELAAMFQLGPEVLSGELFEMAAHGVAYHHAGLLPIAKELVERMFTSGLLKLLFTTETFALGINMPARSVVFHSLRKYDGVRVDYVRTRDYLQMAGRAGRQGLDEEGLVYSMLSKRDLMQAPLERILTGRPEPVESRFRLSFASLLHLVERLGRDRIPEAWRKSFNQFQHRSSNKKAERKNRLEQQRIVDAHLAVLDELGYLDGDELLPRGRVARGINGYELQVTELLFGGELENLPPRALALIFVGLIHEDRRREPTWVPRRMFGDVRARVDGAVHRIVLRTAALGLPIPLKRPDWGLTPAVLAWAGGSSLEELEDVSDTTPGDFCRSVRMAIQLMRQVRKAIHPDWDLHERLLEAQSILNRDEVDARRQLELG